MVKLRDVQCPCVQVFDDLGPSGMKWFNRATFCFDPKIPVLLLTSNNDDIEDQFGDVLTFQGHNLPRLFIKTVQGPRFLAVSLDTVDALSPGDPAFHPPADATTDGIAYQAPAQLISGQDPEVPAAALHDPSLATVMVELKIDKDGQVRAVDLINRPDPDVETATRKALLRWKFKPTLIDGQPVVVRTILLYHLRPKGY